MISLFRAEWTKIVGHRAAIFWLLGIFPTFALLFFLLTSFTATRPAATRLIESSLSNWADLIMLAWMIPSNFFGRLFLLAFTAFTFAGEYQWGTWKNLTYRQSRSKLVLVKFALMTVLVVLTFSLVSAIFVAGGFVLCALADVPMEPAVDRAQLLTTLNDYLLSASLAFLAFVITGVFAALGAIHSKTVLGGTLFGIVMVFVDPALIYGSRLVARLLDATTILQLQRLSPWYNIENVRAWLSLDQPTDMLTASFQEVALVAPTDGTGFSIGVLSAWVVLGVVATVIVFERQDITT